MYWQTEVLRSGMPWTKGTSLVLELPNYGLLSALLLHGYGTPVNDSMIATQKWRMIDFVSKIEVIGNGSTPIKSFPATLGHFLSWMDGAGGAPDKHFNYATSTKRWHGIVPFGRGLFDPYFGLDMSKWRGVELRVTNDASGTYFTGDLTLDVIAVWLRDGKPDQFAGYFKTEVWREYTTVQDGKEYIDLPEEHMLRRIVYQVIPSVDSDNKANTTPYNVAYNIDFTIRTGTAKLFDGSLRDLWYLNYFDHGRDVIQPLEPYHTGGKGIWTGLGQTLVAAGARLPHDATQDTASTSLEPGNDSSTLARYTDVDSDQDSLLVMGLALENCAYIRFNQGAEPDDYLDLVRNASVRTVITTRNDASAAGGTIRVAIDRLLPHPS